MFHNMGDIAPPLLTEKFIYFGSWDKKLYAVKCSSLGLAETAWPMFRGDAQHAGRIADEQTAATPLQLTHLDASLQLLAPAIIRLFANAGAGGARIEQVEFFFMGHGSCVPFGKC